MSATGRGRERVPFDFYPTPPWCVDRLLDRHGTEILSGVDRCLEPTVGDGAIVRAVESWVIRSEVPGTGALPAARRWTGVELRWDALDPVTPLDAHFQNQDFRSWVPWGFGPEGSPFMEPRFDLAIGNPPFSIAEAILRRCFEVSRVTAMLLRLGFLGSSERVEFWRGAGSDLYIRVIPDRPSFDGHGTDSASYAWFIWGVELGGARVDVLDQTPVSVRAAQKPEPPTGVPQIALNWRGTERERDAELDARGRLGQTPTGWQRKKRKKR